MNIYTNLPKNEIFYQLQAFSKMFNVKIINAVKPSNYETSHNEMVLFWLAKSANKLSNYRAKEAIMKIYDALIILNAHKEMLE